MIRWPTIQSCDTFQFVRFCRTSIHSLIFIGPPRAMTLPDAGKIPPLFQHSSLSELRSAIHAVNRLWKLAQRPVISDDALEGRTRSPLSDDLRHVKDGLQLRLMQQFPAEVILVPALDIEGRPEYSLMLPSLGSDAAHCPVDCIESWKAILPGSIVEQHQEACRHHAD